ncbi:MAG: flagellar basal body P-ring formation chaperone FlgA [Acidobacteriota bacterium]
MRKRFATTLLALLLAATVRAGETARVPPSHSVALLARVVLRADSFTLDDLLPRSAPATLHREAMKIVLGQSPQPTASRILYPQQLEFLLRDHADLLAELRLPKEITIRRFHRAVTKDEILRAIDRALGSQGLEGKSSIDARDLQFSTPVYVTHDNPGLEVLRIAPDPLRRETEFTLWTSTEPNNLPFTVSVDRAVKLPTLVARRTIPPGEIVSSSDFAVEMKATRRGPTAPAAGAAGLAGLETRATVQAGEPVERDLFKRPVLVKPGALATLIVHGSAFSIKTIVVPLEQGVLGQEIRVRNVETRQVVQAKVVGRDRLAKTL